MFSTSTIQSTVQTIIRRNQTPFLIITILMSALVGGIVIASKKIDPTIVLAIPVILIAIQVWQRGSHHYSIGVLAVVLSGGIINFFALPTGTESRIVISLLVACALLGIWLLELILNQGWRSLAATPVNKPLLTFATVSIVAFVWGILFRDALVWTPNSFLIVQIASLVVNLALLFLVILIANKVNNEQWLKQLTAIMLAMGILSLFLQLSNNPLQYDILNNGARGLFGAWVALLAYALALFNEKLPPYQRFLLLVIVGVSVFRYFYQGQSWVSGWLPLGVGCVVLTFMRSKRLFLLCMMIGTLYVALNFEQYYDNIVLGEEAEGSGSERVTLWVNNLNHVRNHPIFGMGPAGYAVYNMSYHPEDARSTHNNYFDILAQTGVVGAAAFLWLLGSLIKTCQQNRKRTHKQRDFTEAFANATFAGVFSMIVAMMLGDWVLPFAYNQTISGFDNANYSWVFMGGAVALWRILQERDTNADQMEVKG